eukprot:CAMPEP_0197356718 /NCGR_PEP_ID=MMETSP0893-20130614/49990_1 /TAXON_ID=44058 ORGANISM="Aureoumbra lagunensis, Strain CCMP1510" /NCGR_SAMPLE_ID=MMETSP0893 /ASSEMBLY_ACC=CAM_ASM_000539 /LENGTH=47 /DNA_ID= /DNA_START= /DNA_END= /DNA_ORIENTATION=
MVIRQRIGNICDNYHADGSLRIEFWKLVSVILTILVLQRLSGDPYLV